MFGWDDARQAYQQNYDDQGQPSENKGEFSHELVAGAAAFAGFKAFEDHQRKEGEPVSHQFAKEMIAGFAGAEADKLAETKGADWVDRERLRNQAEEQSKQMYDEHYKPDQCDQYDPNQQGPPDQMQQQFPQQFGNY